MYVFEAKLFFFMLKASSLKCGIYDRIRMIGKFVDVRWKDFTDLRGLKVYFRSQG